MFGLLLVCANSCNYGDLHGTVSQVELTNRGVGCHTTRSGEGFHDDKITLCLFMLFSFWSTRDVPHEWNERTWILKSKFKKVTLKLKVMRTILLMMPEVFFVSRSLAILRMTRAAWTRGKKGGFVLSLLLCCRGAASHWPFTHPYIIHFITDHCLNSTRILNSVTCNSTLY